MKCNIVLQLLLLSGYLFGCSAIKENKSIITFSGRTQKLPSGATALISAGSSASFAFTGESCSVTMGMDEAAPPHGYVAVELDGVYLKRHRIGKSYDHFTINAPHDGTHVVKIFKATEATTGTLVFHGFHASGLATLPERSYKKIEFIGNSITSGMGNDTKEIPCGQGEWYDQHNAYWAYGPITSRALNADFLLSSVSGIGMYRNWNDESGSDVMPNVYEYLYLNRENTKPYKPSFQPDIISIALGTNDFSDGDGTKPRSPFDADKFVAAYIKFVTMLHKNNPNSQFVLVNSPMVNGDRDVVFTSCLNRVVAAFANNIDMKPIKLFRFEAITPRGCTGHPDIEDHKLMAAAYAPFLKKLLDEK